MTVSILTSAIAVVLALTGQSIFSGRLPVIFLLATTLLFGIVEVCTVLLMSRKSGKDNTNRNINIFMVLKTGKLLLSLGLIFIYLLLIKTDTKAFLICFIAIYLIYMAVNIIYMRGLERNKLDNAER